MKIRKRNISILSPVLCSFVGLILITGCSKSSQSTMVSQGVELSIINYTGYNIADVRFKVAGSRATFDNWPVAGSIYFRNTSFGNLKNSEEYSYVRRNCCAVLGSAKVGNEIRVLWDLIYDLNIFEGESSSNFDQYTSLNAPPGSRWCEATVKLPARSSEDNNLIFHILPDGEIRLTFGVGAKLVPLDIEEVKSHRRNFSRARYCDKEVANPWYGLTPKKHFE